MTKAERDLSLTWQHADRRCSISDLEIDILALESTLEPTLENVGNELVLSESDLMDDDLIEFNNRLYAGGCPNGDY